MNQREQGIAFLVALRLTGSRDTVCWCWLCKTWWSYGNKRPGLGKEHTLTGLRSYPCDECYITTKREPEEKYWYRLASYSEQTVDSA